MSTPICKVWDAEQGKYVGIPAIKGTDGHTPVKGTDYWTASDKAEVVAEAAAAIKPTPLTGTTNELTPTQVYDAVSAGIPVKVQYVDSTYGLLSFTAFNISESLNIIVSEIIAYANGVYMLCELFGDKSSNAWGFNVTTLAQKTDIPSDDHINSLIDTKLGVIENGSY